MRRTPSAARAQEGRAGCQGALLGLMAGFITAGALTYYIDISPAAAIALGLFGLLLGAQIAQRLAARRRRGTVPSSPSRRRR